MPSEMVVADLSFDKKMLQDVIRRKLRSLSGSGNWWIARATWQVSIRRACRALPVVRSTNTTAQSSRAGSLLVERTCSKWMVLATLSAA